jgi:hypothetical protein
MASAELKKLLAIQIASGHSVAELAKLHNYSYNGMHRLAHSDEVKALVAEHQRYLMEVASRIYFRFAQHGEALADGMLGDAMNDTHPRQIDARRWILDKLIAPRQGGSSDVNVNFNIQAEVLGDLAQALNRIREVKGTHTVNAVSSPHLVNGRDALPEEALSAEDGGPPPARIGSEPGPRTGEIAPGCGRPMSTIGKGGPEHLVEQFGSGPGLKRDTDA